MSNQNPLEVRANKYAADMLRKVRGDETRVAFGKRVDCTEAQLFQYENSKSRPSFGKLVLIAHVTGVPVTDFVIPSEMLSESDGVERMEAQA